MATHKYFEGILTRPLSKTKVGVPPAPETSTDMGFSQGYSTKHGFSVEQASDPKQLVNSTSLVAVVSMDRSCLEGAPLGK